MIDPERGGMNPRLAILQPVFLSARKRAAEMGKLMVEPTDVLMELLGDTAILEELETAGVYIEALKLAIDKIDAQVSRFQVENFRQAFDLDRTLFTSPALVRSVGIAESIADDEAEDFVLPGHLIAGMIRVGNNTALQALTQSGASPEQLQALSR